ncbi:MAG: hypothetical protein CME71_05790 [Halobacteriovorax sp.]|nr:hypothetical protein [Halobacteriovorax sp.]
MDLNKLDLLYRSAADASTAISLTDANGKIVHVNQLFCQSLEISEADCLGKNHSELFKNLSSELDKNQLKTFFQTNSQWRGEIFVETVGGKKIWTDSTITQVKNEHGEVRGIFVLSLDISEKKSAEQALGHNKNKLSFVLDSLQTAFWEWDMKTNEAWFNDNWPRMLGYEPDEMKMDATAWADYLHPDDRQRTIDEVRYHLKEKTPSLVCLQRFRHKSGKWIHVMTKGRVSERDKNGRATRFIGVNNDISMVSRLEDISQHIQDLADLGIWDMDLQTGSLHWSKNTYKVFGLPISLTPPDLDVVFNLFAAPYRMKLIDAFTKLSKDGTPYDLKLCLKTNKWVRAAGNVEVYEGTPYRAFGILQDIDDTTQAAEALKTSQETLELALEAGDFGVWDWDIANDQAYWSPSMKTLFNIPEARDLQLNDFYQLVHPDDRKKIADEGPAVLEKDSRFDFTYRIKSEDSWKWVRSVANIRRDQRGVASRLIGVTWDVTKEVELEHNQANAVEEAQKASDMKSQFMATVSHEIRTPMSGVIGMTELLSETELSAEQREIVQTIKTCGENLLTLVNDILDYSKLEAEKLELEKRPFSLAETLKNTLDLFQYKARQKRIKLSYHLGPGVPDIIVQDEARLYQVLFNLIGNAVKFTSEGEIIVQVEKKQGALSFRVTDTGVGIPKDKLEYIFDSFTQLTPGQQTDNYGTGLGLSISKSIVELMGGQLGVTSKVGEGSCFYFDMEIVTDSSSIKVDKKARTAKAPLELSRLRILVVEDNPINLKLLVSILSKHGVQIDTAEDGVIAVEKCNKNDYDIVFMDVQMPRLDGLEATKLIRQVPGKETNPVIIALTANVSQAHKTACLDAGMTDFLPKPIRVQTIRSLLQHHVENIDLVDSSSSMQSIEASESAPILNQERLLKEFDGFEDLLLQFVQIFIGNYATYLQQIDTEIANNQLVEVARTVHTFKGIIGNFQSSIIIKNLELLEDLAKSENQTALRQCFIDTTSLIGKLVEEIRVLNTRLEAEYGQK